MSEREKFCAGCFLVYVSGLGAVVETHDCRSKKIYNYKLMMI